jgi:hypothetical protein
LPASRSVWFRELFIVVLESVTSRCTEGDGITNDNTLTLTCSAEANATVQGL